LHKNSGIRKHPPVPNQQLTAPGCCHNPHLTEKRSQLLPTTCQPLPTTDRLRYVRQGRTLGCGPVGRAPGCGSAGGGNRKPLLPCPGKGGGPSLCKALTKGRGKLVAAAGEIVKPRQAGLVEALATKVADEILSTKRGQAASLQPRQQNGGRQSALQPMQQKGQAGVSAGLPINGGRTTALKPRQQNGGPCGPGKNGQVGLHATREAKAGRRARHQKAGRCVALATQGAAHAKNVGRIPWKTRQQKGGGRPPCGPGPVAQCASATKEGGPVVALATN
jgi:hypothetical protein